MIGSSIPAPLSEAEVVAWLKRSLKREGLLGRPVSDILVDADGSYLNSRFQKELEPTGSIWIGGWRPDLICLVQTTKTELVVGFEVKAGSDHEKGVVQASRYRSGVHEAYLCIPAMAESPSLWLTEIAAQTGIGIVHAESEKCSIAVPPAPLKPDPEALQNTRRYLLGDASIRAFGLNKPVHYLAVAVAHAFYADTASAFVQRWGAQGSMVPHALRGARTLGLLSVEGALTPTGFAYAEAARALGFDLSHSRYLTRKRLSVEAPGLAALLQTLLLQNPAISLVIRILLAERREMTVLELAERAQITDDGMARALFGPPPEKGEMRQIRRTTRNIFKANLYDVGLLSTPLAPHAQEAQIPQGGYDPSQDPWASGAIPHTPTQGVSEAARYS